MSHLLPKAYSRACVEGKEYERIRDKILLVAFIQKSVGVKFVSWSPLSTAGGAK